jgi:hypothetical protein
MNSELVSDYLATSNRNNLAFLSKIIEQVCSYLGHTDRSSETVAHFVNPQLLKKIKTSTKVKDKNLPKGPKSGYLFFQEKVRSEILEKSPDIKPTEIMVEAGKRWGLLSEEEKAPYNEMAKKDKERHLDDMEKYKSSAVSGVGITNAPSDGSSSSTILSSPKKAKRSRESSSPDVEVKTVTTSA